MNLFKRYWLKSYYWLKRVVGLMPQSSLEQDWIANEKKHARLMEVWAAEQRAHNLRPAQLVKIKRAYSGNVYFEYKDFAQLPVERMHEFEALNVQLLYNIDSPDNFTLMVETITKSIQTGDIKSVRESWNEFLTRLNSLSSKSLMCRMAALFMIRHDENPHELNPQIQNEKVAELDRDSNLSAFFLTRCLEICTTNNNKLMEKYKRLGIDNGQDLHSYFLKEIANKQKQNHQKA